MSVVAARPAAGPSASAHLERVVARVVAAVDPLAIVLVGSFGRGEGSLPDGSVELSDYEIAVVTSHLTQQRVLNAIAAELSAEFGMGVTLFVLHPDRFRNFRARNRSRGPSRLTIESYELFRGARRLYQARDFAIPAPPSPALLPVWEGFRLVFNRCCELLAHTHLGAEPADPDAALRQANWSAKTLIACGSALLIWDRAYDVSMRERVARLERRPELLARVFRRPGHFLAALRDATEWKLHPHRLDGDAVRALWFSAQGATDQTVRFLLAKELGIRFGAYAALPADFLAAGPVCRDYSDYLWGSRMTPAYHNLFTGLKVLRRGRPTALVELLRHPLQPWHHRAYLGGLLTLMSARPDGSIDRDTTLAAARLVRGFMPRTRWAYDDEYDDPALWDLTRAAVADFWSVVIR